MIEVCYYCKEEHEVERIGANVTTDEPGVVVRHIYKCKSGVGCQKDYKHSWLGYFSGTGLLLDIPIIALCMIEFFVARTILSPLMNNSLLAWFGIVPIAISCFSFFYGSPIPVLVMLVLVWFIGA